jgi:hypothetical protein
MSAHSANPKSFGYLIDLLHIRAIFSSFGSRLLGISACDHFFQHFTAILIFACSALLYHTLQAFSERSFLAMLFWLGFDDLNDFYDDMRSMSPWFSPAIGLMNDAWYEPPKFSVG